MFRRARPEVKKGEMDRVLNELRHSTDVDGSLTTKSPVVELDAGSTGPRLSVADLRPIAMVVIFLACVASVLAAVLQRDNGSSTESDQGLSLIADGGPQPSDTSLSVATTGTDYGDELTNGPESVTEREQPDNNSDSGRFQRSSGTAPVISVTTVAGSTSASTAPTVTAEPTTTSPPSTEPPTTLAPTTIELPTTTAAPPATVAPPPTSPPAPDWAVLYSYDFGPAGSPVKAGFVGISPGQGGAVNFSGGGLQAVDRAVGPLMRQDLVYSSGQRAFNHAVVNGTYRVAITMGDAGHAHDEMAVKSEGVVLASGVTTAAGEFKVVAGVVEVLDGELKVVFWDQGGTNPDWVLNGISIEIDRNNPPGS